MTRPALVKLGGSVLTNKAHIDSFRRAVARRLVGEIAKSKVPVVLCHGAGSFGHPHVINGKLNIGDWNEHKTPALARTLASAGLLHAEIVSLAAAAGLNPLSIPLQALATIDGDTLGEFPTDAIAQAIANGFTPVLGGTMVPNDLGGWTVLSADAIMAQLAGEVTPRLAVFVSDVDGVLDANGNLVPQIAPGVDIADYGGDVPDVTDGMPGKARAALEIAQFCPTVILNGMARGRLQDALKGKDVPGTRPLS